MEAGRELDAEVAEKVLGWTAVHKDPARRWGNYPMWHDSQHRYMDVPHYSTDMADAMLVADAFDEVDLHKGPHGWLCRLERGDDSSVEHGEAIRAATAPLAICLAALATVES